MNPTLTTSELFAAQHKQLKLTWLAGKSGKDKQLESVHASYPGMALVGHLNFVHPNRVQVLGATELAYLNSLNQQERRKATQDLFACQETAMVVVTNNIAPDDLIEGAEKSGLPLLSSPLPSPIVIEHLQYFLARALASRITMHGVFMEVMGIGVFIIGESGIGKSELALELLSRSHRLIADDAVEFVRAGPDILVGQSLNKELLEYLEVRGLGILNVRNMFGETAVRHKKKLHFVVRLDKAGKKNLTEVDRIQAEHIAKTILDVEIPEVVLFVAPGRNLAVLVEAATRTHILRMWGMNPVEEFIGKQETLLSENKS